MNRDYDGRKQRLFRRIQLTGEERAAEAEKKEEVLRVLDQGDFGQVVVHKYKGQIVQVQERWDHRFPRHMTPGFDKKRANKRADEDLGGFSEAVEEV
jgi:hypothetical protein